MKKRTINKIRFVRIGTGANSFDYFGTALQFSDRAPNTSSKVFIPSQKKPRIFLKKKETTAEIFFFDEKFPNVYTKVCGKLSDVCSIRRRKKAIGGVTIGGEREKKTILHRL